MALFVENPPVPYIGPLNNIGSQLIVLIAGQPLPNAKWFAINLQCGPQVNPRSDIAFHLSPRFEGNTSKVIRNSLQNQQWGLEENFGHFPFMPDQPFEIMILVENDHFKVAINGEHYTEFRHRIPINRIDTIAIDGEVQLFAIKTEIMRAPSPNPQTIGLDSVGVSGQQNFPPSQSGPPQIGFVIGNSATPQPAFGSAFVEQPEFSAPVGGMPYGYAGGPSMPPAGAVPPGGYYNYPQQPPGGYGYGYPQQSQAQPGYYATSNPMQVPMQQPHASQQAGSGFDKYLKGGLGGLAAGAIAAYGASKLRYPGYYPGQSYGGLFSPGAMLGHLVMGKKAKKMHKKHGHGMGMGMGIPMGMGMGAGMHYGGHGFQHKYKHKPKFKKGHWKHSSSSSSD